MADAWTFNDFPGLVLTYYGPRTRDDIYAEYLRDGALYCMMTSSLGRSPKPDDFEDEILGNFTICAELDGLYAGGISVERFDDAKQVDFANLQVEKHFEGRGIGKRLTCAAIVKARELGFSIATGVVAGNNIGSRKVLACSGANFSEPIIDNEGQEYFKLTFDLNVGRA